MEKPPSTSDIPPLFSYFAVNAGSKEPCLLIFGGEMDILSTSLLWESGFTVENRVGPRSGGWRAAQKPIEPTGLAPLCSPTPCTPPEGASSIGDPFRPPVHDSRPRPGWTLCTLRVSQKVSAVTLIQGSFWKRDDLNSSLAGSPGREPRTGSRRSRPPPPPPPRPPAG